MFRIGPASVLNALVGGGIQRRKSPFCLTLFCFLFCIIPGFFVFPKKSPSSFHREKRHLRVHDKTFRRTHTSALLLLVCVSVSVCVLYSCASLSVCMPVCVTVTLCVTRFRAHRLPSSLVLASSCPNRGIHRLEKEKKHKKKRLGTKCVFCHVSLQGAILCVCVRVLCGSVYVCVLYGPHCTRWGNTLSFIGISLYRLCRL